MMESLQEKTGSWLQGGMDVRGRDGESGTSKLTELRTPLTWSSSPFGDSRFDFTVTPVSLTPGPPAATPGVATAPTRWPTRSPIW